MVSFEVMKGLGSLMAVVTDFVFLSCDFGTGVVSAVLMVSADTEKLSYI